MRPKAFTPGDVDRRLREIGQLDLRIEARQARMLRALNRIKAAAGEQLEPLRAERARLEAKLLAECQAAREVLFPDDSKTLALGAGKISWRYKPPRIELAPGIQEAEALDRCVARGFSVYLREIVSLDKEAVKKDAVAGALKAKDLERLGLVLLENEEVWQAKPDLEAVREAVGKP